MAYLLNIPTELKNKVKRWGERNGIKTLSQTIIYILTQWVKDEE